MSRDRDTGRGGGTGRKILLALIMASLAREAFAAQPKSPTSTNTNNINISPTQPAETSGNITIAKLDGVNFPTMNEVTTSKAVFLQQFKDSHSPIPLDEASAIYDLAISKHVDPNFLLALGIHESKLGNDGIAQTTKSFCNMRPWWDIHTQPPPPGLAVYTNGNGPYVDFSHLNQSWYHSADACVNAISGWSHIKGHPLSVPELVTIFAPPSDKNDTPAYIRAVENSMKYHNDKSLGITGRRPNYYFVRRDPFS